MFGKVNAIVGKGSVTLKSAVSRLNEKIQVTIRLEHSSKGMALIPKGSVAMFCTLIPKEGEVIDRPVQEAVPAADDNELYMKEALKQGKKEWRRSNIMIVGEGRAGKTALANSILGRAYEDMDSTIGINEFTCSIGYAGIGNTDDNKEKGWKELKDQKKSKEYETAVASLVLDQKNKRQPTDGKDTTTDVDEITKSLQGGYLEGESRHNDKVNETMSPVPSSPHLEDTKVIYEDVVSNDSSTAVPNRSEREVPLDEVECTRDEQPPKEFSQEIEPARKEEEFVGPSEIDTSLVMKYLGEQSNIDSKFIISVFDFGGQSVFNVIHPFFLTRFGVYVVTFNMEWLSCAADPAIREECVRYLSFWLNSVLIHTQNEKGEVAPIFLVGTRKDLITSPAEHQQISTFLYNAFCNSLVWSYVIENNGAEGPFGKADLCFFPVNNKLGNQDPTVQKLLQLTEQSIDQSNYVHVERPLSWFQVFDIFKSKNVPYLSYNEVESIVTACDIPKERVSVLLKFFHEMGILMWHDEDTLRDVVVFDPIEYFVKPATIVICKHNPDKVDGIYHSLEIHRKVKKVMSKEFREMIQHGIVSEPLLIALLEEHSSNYKFIKQLMLKYGLLVPLILSRSSEYEEDNENNEGTDQEILFLAPALLPDNNNQPQNIPSSSSHSFSFVFTPSKDLSHMPIVSFDDCKQLGFLPSGLFEKLITKAITWSMTTSDYVSRSNLYNCYKNYAELAFGNQRFQMSVDYYHNFISIHVLEGNNPVSIHDRLRDQIQEIISECLKSLKFISVLNYQLQKTETQPSDKQNSLFIRLNQIRSLVEKKSALSINIPGGRNLLSSTEALQLYGPWLTDFLSYNEFDLFISYRWGRFDSNFTQGLFDRLSLHSVDSSMRTIRTFLDIKRLQAGENYQHNIVNSLSKSLLIIPVVSSEALQRMITLKATEEDNLLLEWICGLELVKHQQKQQWSSSRLMKFMPIFFGSRADENNMKNFFQENVLSKLPDYSPIACLEVSKGLLSKAGITMSSEMTTASIKDIVTEVTKYLFLCAWESKNAQHLTVQAANKIVTALNEGLQQEQKQHELSKQSVVPSLPSHPQEITPESTAPTPTATPSSTEVNYEEVWKLIQVGNSSNPDALKALLDDFGMNDSNDVKYLEEDDVRNIANVLKKIPRKKLLDAFHLK
jgi:GTPase SAR1 family protein